MPRSLDSDLDILHLWIRIPAPLHTSMQRQPPSNAYLIRRRLELHANDIIRRADVDALDGRVDEEDVVPRLRTGIGAKSMGARGAQAQTSDAHRQVIETSIPHNEPYARAVEAATIG